MMLLSQILVKTTFFQPTQPGVNFPAKLVITMHNPTQHTWPNFDVNLQEILVQTIFFNPTQQICPDS